MNPQRPTNVSACPSRVDNRDGSDPNYPSVRYFRVHFEQIYETINELKVQILATNHQIATLQRTIESQRPDPLQNADPSAMTGNSQQAGSVRTRNPTRIGT